MFVSLEDYNCSSKLQLFQKTLQSFLDENHIATETDIIVEIDTPDEPVIPDDGRKESIIKFVDMEQKQPLAYYEVKLLDGDGDELPSANTDLSGEVVFNCKNGDKVKIVIDEKNSHIEELSDNNYVDNKYVIEIDINYLITTTTPEKPVIPDATNRTDKLLYDVLFNLKQKSQLLQQFGQRPY